MNSPDSNFQTGWASPPQSNSGSWRGANVMDRYDMGAIPKPSANQNVNLGINTLTSGASGGLAGGPPGFVLSALATLASGILGSMFAPKPPKSPQEVYFDRMTKFYYRLGERARTAEYVKTMFNPGYQRQDTSIANIVKTHPYNEPTYGESQTNVPGNNSQITQVGGSDAMNVSSLDKRRNRTSKPTYGAIENSASETERNAAAYDSYALSQRTHNRSMDDIYYDKTGLQPPSGRMPPKDKGGEE